MVENTPSQQKAIERIEGPCVIIAGAGTGKTSTMREKIAFLLTKGVKPEDIVALTFSTESADEIKRKLEQVKGSSRVKVSTFHSFCLSLIEEHADLLGMPFSIRVFSEEDIALLLFENGLSTTEAKRFSNTIVKAKDNNISKDDYVRYIQELKSKVALLLPNETLWETRREEADLNLKTFHLLTKEEQKQKKDQKKDWQEFVEAYDKFMQYTSFFNAWELYDRLKPRDALDYADMQLKALELLNRHGTGLLPVISHVIVDEFQDTSKVQFELIKLLSEKTQNITIVGDRNQSIYAFRGAFTDNIDAFLDHFKVSAEAIIPLETSFRSTQHILDVSHELILHNYPEEKKADCIKLVSDSGKPGEKVVIIDCENELEEARAVAEKINGLIDSGVPSSQIAVLFRSYKQSSRLQDELVRRQIQFRITSSEALFHKPYIKTVLAYLYALSHMQKPLAKGSESLWRLFHYHDSLSHEDSYSIGSFLKDHKDVTITDIIFKQPEGLIISQQGKAVIERVKERLASLKDESSLPNLILAILEKCGLSRQFSHIRTAENTEAMMHLRDFHELAVNFAESHGDDLGRFIGYIELLDTLQATPRANKYEESDVLRLMSMHAAKGLQFEHVFLIGFYDKKFPLMHGGTEPLIPPELDPQLKQLFLTGNPTEDAIKEEKKERKLREERRLCYVAMTRAKNKLTITTARKLKEKDAPVSVFLNEIGFTDWRDQKTTLELEHLTYVPDLQEVAQPLAPQGRLEKFKSHHRQLLNEAMDAKNPKEALRELLQYLGLSGINPEELKKLCPLVPEDDLKQELAKAAQDLAVLSFDPKTISFSYSGLKSYSECPKRFELQTVLRMPKRADDDMSAPTSVGSFIHSLLENAIKKNARTFEDLKKELDELTARPEYREVDKNRALTIITVFWERNKEKLALPHKVEERFNFTHENVNFNGLIDRTDELPDGIEIVDYKTGKDPEKKPREWQLAMYAYAAEKDWGLKPRFLTLELLECDKPRRFEIRPDGTAVTDRITFNIHDAMKEMVETAKKALNDYEKGFEPTEDDNTCQRCEYKLYCPKWG